MFKQQLAHVGGDNPRPKGLTIKVQKEREAEHNDDKITHLYELAKCVT